jgi:AcrR family transcriptional regulator
LRKRHFKAVGDKMRNVNHTIYQSLFPQKLQKSDFTKLRILESAIWCYVKFGIEKSTYDNIASKAKITRPLVMRYFPEKEVLLQFTIKYIRANLQKIAVDSVSGLSQSDEILEAYVKSTFYWIEKYPEHAKVWLLFYYYCSINQKFIDINTELVNMGQRRIADILVLGNQQKKFKVKTVDLTAKAIQNLITGSLLSALTEKADGVKLEAEQVIKMCLKLTRS